MSIIVGLFFAIYNNVGEGVFIMANKQTTQNRKSKFHDDILNVRLRELLDDDGVRTEEVAAAVGIGSSAVRSWYTGYARPDIEKIPAICKFFNISADWLLGLSETQAVDIEMRDICKKTGLSENALYNLMQYSKEQNKGGRPTSPMSATAAEKLWFINHLIDDAELTDTLVSNANMYVNMRNAVENFEIPQYDGFSAIEITKLGLERLGMTFNFTQGKETADFYAFQCQQNFIEFIENIAMPAYFVLGWETEEREKTDPNPETVEMLKEFLADEGLTMEDLNE